jgi:ElaA protein
MQSIYRSNTDELYQILQLKNEAFVVEQNCIYQNCDNKDQGSYHLCDVSKPN